jgi:lipoate-protein ligase A
MALDEALAREAQRPVLRFYGWARPSVSIGCFQDADEVNLEYLLSEGMPLVRRLTGGRGILHGHELTYSFSAPVAGIFKGGLRESYSLLGKAFAGAFKALGLEPEISRSKRLSGRSRSPLCFESASLGEIKLGGRKVFGSAQKRWPGRFMQQGSIPFRIELSELLRVFRSGGGPNVEDSMTGLLDEAPSLDPDVLKGAIVSAFKDGFGIEFDESASTSSEEDLARELGLRYRSPDWNLRRQRSTSLAAT